MSLTYRKYVRGSDIPLPAYIDANVWASHFISARAKHATSSAALGELLIQGGILVSTVVFSEICWAVLEHIYNEERKSQDSKAQLIRLSITELQRNRDWLLPKAEPRLKQVLETIVSLTPVRMVPDSTAPMKIVPAAIVSHQLAPSDAVHLCLASSFAKSFFTENSHDFEGLSDPSVSLVVYIV